MILPATPPCHSEYNNNDYSALTFLCASAVVCLADNPQMGTWKLNEAKSKLGPGTGKNHTVIYVEAADNVKITVDGVDAEGKPTHNEWTGKFDRKLAGITHENRE